MNPLRLAAAACLLTLPAAAQDYHDALRYSMLSPQGTARSIGFGGALGSVGADFSALSVNPAGIALYRRGELSFTPSFRFGNTSGAYLGSSRSESSGGFSISNAGIVGTNVLREGNGGWKSYSVGFGINRMADFNREYSYSGLNTTSSGSEAFAIDANQQSSNTGEIPVNTLGDLGYQAYLIDSSNGAYFSNITPLAQYNDALRQTRSVRERGGLTEMLFSVGGNYDERVMIGATLGVPIVRYRREISYTESDANNTYADFDNFTYNETLKTTGAGVNVKLGIILKPSDGFRLGASIHSPTWFSLTDELTQSVTSTTTLGGVNRTYTLDPNEFSYNLRTPWRGVLSATGFLGSVGFLTADYEYVDYSSARFNFNTDENQYLAGSGAFAQAQQQANDSVRGALKGASNIRIGGEAHMGSLFFRAGYGFYGNPYRRSPFDAARTDISAGLGIRGARGFVDIGMVHSEYANAESPYLLSYTNGPTPPVARLENKLTNIAITIGFKF